MISNFIEKYALDQFPFRDNFLKLKTFSDYNILRKLDSSNLFINDNHIYKLDYPLNESEIYNFADKLNQFYKISLIDSKYMSTSNLKYFIEFNNQYILFLYNTSIINNSSMLK